MLFAWVSSLLTALFFVSPPTMREVISFVRADIAGDGFAVVASETIKGSRDADMRALLTPRRILLDGGSYDFSQLRSSPEPERAR